MNISIACGGTGGHLFPGLAVAKVLRARGNVVTLWVDSRALVSATESKVADKVEVIKAKGFSFGVSLQSVGAIFSLLGSVISCWRRMFRNRPDVVLAMGSYASFGPVVAARLLGVPVVLHEANAVPGRAISLLAKFSSVVAITFSDCAKYLTCRTELTGFPVRDSIVPYFPDDIELEKNVFTVLIMGGSQGAHKLNEVGCGAFSLLAENGVSVQVVHLTGKADEMVVREKYMEMGIKHLVYPFLEDMGLAYGVSDLVICRAGASTCMELAKFRLPALLVPLPSAMRDHQTANAKFFVGAGAADMIVQSELSAESLAEYINMLVDDRSLLVKKRECLKNIAIEDASERIADLVEKCG